MHADLLLIDEAAGRAEAKRRHLRVTGTLGVLGQVPSKAWWMCPTCSNDSRRPASI
jgi:predicted nucleic acid-binding protein